MVSSRLSVSTLSLFPFLARSACRVSNSFADAYRHCASAGAFDDAEVTHVEGDVDPCRDMEIISTELRLKDAEWVEKHLNTLKKTFRGTGTLNLADKAKKEEIVCVEKVFKTLTEDNKDVRKVDWSNKEVRRIQVLYFINTTSPPFHDPPAFLALPFEDDSIRYYIKPSSSRSPLSSEILR